MKKLLLSCIVGLTCPATMLAQENVSEESRSIETPMVKRSDGKPASLNTLKSYCILPESIAKIDPPRDMPDHAIEPTKTKYPCKKEIWIRNGDRCVAIIRHELNGTVALNPKGKGFEYGPIPDLRDMTRAQAEQLWGPGENSSNDVIIYKLSTYQRPSDVFIDVIFRDDRICKYRIRNVQIPAQWNKAN